MDKVNPKRELVGWVLFLGLLVFVCLSMAAIMTGMI